MNNKKDNIRRCSWCGKPMKEGYVLGDEYACGLACAIELYDGDETMLWLDIYRDEDEELGEVYYTEWDDIYLD